MQIQVVFVFLHFFFSTRMGEVLSETMEVYHAKAKGWGEMVARSVIGDWWVVTEMSKR